MAAVESDRVHQAGVYHRDVVGAQEAATNASVDLDVAAED